MTPWHCLAIEMGLDWKPYLGSEATEALSSMYIHKTLIRNALKYSSAILFSIALPDAFHCRFHYGISSLGTSKEVCNKSTNVGILQPANVVSLSSL
jgi:hypothetical protein